MLTDRQRDCVLWAARGKGDWEISRILGVGEETVARHIKLGCARYGVNKRTLLAIRALFDGTLTRSEEHTSELQSLMRTSYAVFCLKNKNYAKQLHNIRHTKRLNNVQDRRQPRSTGCIRSGSCGITG